MASRACFIIVLATLSLIAHVGAGESATPLEFSSRAPCLAPCEPHHCIQSLTTCMLVLAAEVAYSLCLFCKVVIDVCI